MPPAIERWIRSPGAAVADAGGHVYLVARDRTVRRIEGDSAALARAVLDVVAAPRTLDDIVAHVESLAGPLGDRRGVVTDLVALLAETGAIAPASVDHRAPPANIVVAISGAIAATHAPALVSALHRRGHTVEVALTEAAQRFVAVDALAAIAGREIHTTLWPHTPHAAVPHVALAQWVDLVVIYPASATTIARIAGGDFSDLVSALALTTRAPVIVAPSMNADMLAAPAVQRNLDRLRDDGFILLHGVPSQEVADAPALRGFGAAAAPPPGEVAATIDALRAAGVLARHDERAARTASSSSDWDAVYRAHAVPWSSPQCDADIAAALADVAAPARVLDVGCGLGQVARHAASIGHRVVATDVSEVALHAAASLFTDGAVTFVRDDICASGLVGPFDVIVDRAVLHTLPASRVHAWAAAVERLAAPNATVIVKAHRDGIAGVTTGWTASAIAERLPAFELVRGAAADLPGIADATPIPAALAVLRRR